MKNKLRVTIAILLTLTTVLTFFGADTHAVIFDNLDTDTAVAGASRKLQSFYEKNPDALALLDNFFNPVQEVKEGEFFDDEYRYGEAKEGIVSAEALLNVRSLATVNSDTIWILNRGDTVTVLGEQRQRIVTKDETTDFIWFKVQGNGVEGFVRGEFVAFGDEASALTAKIEEEKKGVMPDRFVVAEEISEDLAAQFKSVADEINWCQNEYNNRAAENVDNPEADSLNMYSILIYLSELYQKAASLAQANGLSVTYNRAMNGFSLIGKERNRMTMVTGKSEEDFYTGIQMESEEYKRQQAAAAEAERLAAEQERIRQAQAQAALEAANAAARAQAEEAARRAAAEAERLRQQQAAAEAAARQAAQEEAARIAAAGAGEAGGTIGRQIADFAAQYVGVLPYVWGGASLSSGADCSGFVGQVMAHFGLLDQAMANRHGYDSYGLRNVGTPVTYDASSIGEFVKYLVPGDILCYPGHVAIYYGNGIAVHAPDVGRKVEFGSAMMKQVVAVRRMAK